MERNLNLEKPSAGRDEDSKRLPYRELIGSLMYAAVSTRPDILFSVSHLARYMTCYSESHWKAAKQILKYLNKTKNSCLVYRESTQFQVIGFTDTSWSSDSETRRSVSGYVFKAGGAAISWKSSLQKCVAGSTLEGEYIAQALSTREALWIQKLCKVFQLSQEAISIYADNTGAISSAKDKQTTPKTKHIDIS